MNTQKKSIIFATVLILVAFAVFLGVENGSQPQKGSVNSMVYTDPKTESAISKYEEGLTDLQKLGYIDSDTASTALAAGKKYDAEVIQKSDSPINLITLAALLDGGYIDQKMRDVLAAALEKQHQDVDKEKYAPLVASGAFTSTDEASTAYDAFLKHYQKVSDEAKQALLKEIEAANQSLSDDEKAKKSVEFKKGQGERIITVLNQMVARGEINAEQEKALKSFIKK